MSPINPSGSIFKKMSGIKYVVGMGIFPKILHSNIKAHKKTNICIFVHLNEV